MSELTNEQIAAGAAVIGDNGRPIGRNTAIMVADAMFPIQSPAPMPEQVAPDCGLCNDSGIVGFPPDQYEACPECNYPVTQQAAKAETVVQVGWATFGSKDGKYKFDQAMLASNPDYIKEHDSFIWEAVYLAPTTSTVSASGNSSKNSSSSEGDQAAVDDVRNQALEEAVEAADAAYLSAQCSIERGEFSQPIRQTREAIEAAIRALRTTPTAAQAAADKSED